MTLMIPIDIAALEAAVTTQTLGHPLRYLETVESTQDVVREAARQGAAEGLAVLAGQQRAGKGRLGRSWWSPPAGGLYLSLLLRPDLPGQRLAWVTMCLALGAAEAVQQVCGLRADIKWPNDLEIAERKLAGILAEGAFDGDRLDFVIAGLGLNANVDFAGQPQLAATAASLQGELGRPVDLAGLLAAILERVEFHYLALQQGRSPQQAWLARLATLGQEVEARFGDGRVVAGLASGVLPDGALCIRLADGRETCVRAVDVTLRRSL